MKLLLIGPYPPPHGGISVHVAEAKQHLERSGIPVRVLNTIRRAPGSEQYASYRNGMDFVARLVQHARSGWTLHLHTNGHNTKSWLMALICGMAGKYGAGCFLTLHSGMAPSFLREGPRWRRLLARSACWFYDRVIAVNPEIQAALVRLGVASHRTEVLPAYLATSLAAPLPPELHEFSQCHWPVLTTVLFHRPEYGFDLLMRALFRLQETYPKVGCFVLGGGEQEQDAKRYVQEKRLEDAAMLLGDIPHELCLGLISHCDVFIRCTLTDGDAISVREALSLGVPVVASDVGTRPNEALLFRAGSLDDLVLKVETVLSSPSRNADQREPQRAWTGFQRLLEMYRQSKWEGARG